MANAAIEEARRLQQQGKSGEAIDYLSEIYKFSQDVRVGRNLAMLLLQKKKYADLVSLPRAHELDSRMWAIADHLSRVDHAGMPVLPVALRPATNKVALVVMIKDEEDIILSNLVWHYGLGVRLFFVIDNLSMDGTRRKLAEFEKMFPDVTLFVLRDPVVEHYQGRKVTGACRFIMALRPEIEWFLLVDADEFVCVEGSLVELLSQVPAECSAVMLPKSVYALIEGDTTDNSAPFYERIRHRQPLDHVSNKTLIRAKVGINVAQGNHRVVDQPGCPATQYDCVVGLTMREYPVRSYAQFKRKVISGGRAVEAAKQAGFAEVGGQHWAAQYQQYQQKGDAGLEEIFNRKLRTNKSTATLDDPLPLAALLNELTPEQRILLQGGADI